MSATGADTVDFFRLWRRTGYLAAAMYRTSRVVTGWVRPRRNQLIILVIVVM